MDLKGNNLWGVSADDWRCVVWYLDDILAVRFNMGLKGCKEFLYFSYHNPRFSGMNQEMERRVWNQRKNIRFNLNKGS